MVKPTGAAAGNTATAPPAAKRGRGRPKVVKISDDQYESSRKELLARKTEIQTRLNKLNVKPSTNKVVTTQATSNDDNGVNKSSTTQDVANNNNNASSNVMVDFPSSTTKQPILPNTLKTDVHWDFTLKEMAWLSADFQSERKRQISQAKKLSNAILQYHATLATKKIRERANYEARVRRLGSKLGRLVYTNYWKKMERVVEYKQKLEGENNRRKEMDKRLIFLVRQTERYGERLNQTTVEYDEDDGSTFGGGGIIGGRSGIIGDRKMTIEESLSSSLGRRKSKSSSIDYSKLDKDMEVNDDTFLRYGHTTTTTTTHHNTRYSSPSKKQSNISNTLEEDTSDYYELPTEDELIQEIQEEELEYTTLVTSFKEQSTKEEIGLEITKLIQERDMDIDLLLRRLMEEGELEQEQQAQEVAAIASGGETMAPEKKEGEEEEEGFDGRKKQPPLIEVVNEKPAAMETDDGDEEDGNVRNKKRRVCFALTEGETFQDTNAADATLSSGNEDKKVAAGAPQPKSNNFPLLNEDDHEEKDEFHLEREELDDETTIEAEERLGRDMSYEAEIDLLKQENEMSIEELRAMYANMDEGGSNNTATSEDEDDAPAVSSSEGVNKVAALASLDEDDHEEKDEFHLGKEDVDDETTIEAEERLGRDMSYEAEIDLLKQENEMSIEELRAMYANMERDNAGSVKDEESEAKEEDDIAGDAPTTKAGIASLDEDDHEEKDEFHLEREELDDETTIEAEERLGRDISYEAEIDLLKQENEMSIEELKAMYANMEGDNAGSVEDGGSSAQEEDGSAGDAPTAKGGLASLDEDDHEEKDEFHLEREELDDETTIEAEERLGRDMSYEAEIDLLKRENEMSVEELRAMYPPNIDEGSNEDEESESAQPDTPGDIDEDGMDISPDTSSKRKATFSDDVSSAAKKAKVGETDEGISALESLAASDTKARETMLTRPFLLASWVKLRAYQHVGLNWLVSIQSRRLNGILADEMGLGKTLQTISMLAYLSSYKGIWGPHLIIVPTSCLVNWEVEFKRFCPGLKVLCYYGNAKRRKELRTGWTKPNVYHVVITSYQIAVQDSFAFKRKKWYYLILDEAHNIKNFESQRWQTLIGFNTQRRLLLTGTPLQNNLMELWSLLHFLMPHVFTDRKQFSYWFSNPMDNIIEGNAKRNDDLINRLHGIIRPFVLRRLKKDVETQLPGKFEHIVNCQLSRRQMFLYEEFMARSSTRKAMSGGGNFMGMMSVLMQLRKVCNHPDLFEPRSVTTPFVMEPLSLSTAACVVNAVESKSALEEVSPFLRLPLWTVGRGTPSFERSTSVNSVLAGQLSDLKTPASAIIEDVSDDDLTEPMPHSGLNAGLFSFLSRIRAAEKQERVSRAQFISSVNAQRCEALEFPYSDQLCHAVSIGPGLCDLPLRNELSAPLIASTPLELLTMRKTQEERAAELDEVAEKFVFCVPKAGTKKPVLFSSNNNLASVIVERTLTTKTSSALDNYFTPFKKAQSRLTMCFPDKKLVQFDAGKLQKLAVLLRELKQGGHRVLVFTQMSKMLDVLEAFLNLNGHTYLRLDGATDVERRQRLMDRFNNDPKIFCFILSTRSGGLGINLTGADTVIFYDSDWNPAMDAQAQDRAHRIGQTREVHIYRMVTEHSIEENILRKARQKSNLDFLVMDEGKFHANDGPSKEVKTEDDSTFTKDKLQNILGIQDEVDETPESNTADGPMNKVQLESAMAALEDEDDVKAMQSAKQEAAEELQEFNEQEKQDDKGEDSKVKTLTEKKPKKKVNRLSTASMDSTGSDNPKSSDTVSSDDEKEMEKEFAKWQRKAGMDATTIHESLNPLERYGLNIKEHIDPYYSKYFWAEYQRLSQTTNENSEWDIEEIEQRKVKEELKAFEDGDLLGTFPEPESLPRQRELYIREKARLKSEIVKRKLTGQNWSTRIDERIGKPYWYNADTGEATWEKPNVLNMLEAEEVARVKGWMSLPNKLLVRVMEFLSPFPERTTCAATCSNWRTAANDESFILHVWPVEQGAMVMDKSKLIMNHFRTLSDAIEAARPGDTIELGDGHYFINDPGLVVNKPIKIVGDENEPSHVILELSGEIVWKSQGGWIEGITIRRPRIATGATPNNEILRVESGGRLDMFNCLLDNQGSMGNCVSCDSGGRWEKISITGASRNSNGLFLKRNAKVELIDCTISDNDGVGIAREDGAVAKLSECTVERNGLATHTTREEEVKMMISPAKATRTCS